MKVNDVLRYCEEHGRKVSRQGLYSAGMRYGFITKTKGKASLDFDKEKFIEWFNKGLEDIPDNYIRISELMKRYDLTLVFAYALLKDPGCEHRKFGRGNGVTYVNVDGIEEIIERNRNKRKHECDK